MIGNGAYNPDGSPRWVDDGLGMLLTIDQITQPPIVIQATYYPPVLTQRKEYKMTGTTPASAPAVAASTSSMHTMLQTIETGTEILQKVLPEVAAVAGFVPGATPFIQLVGMALGPVQNAIKFIMQEEGKTPLEAFEDFLKHISPGNGFVSPSLSKLDTPGD